MYYLVFSTTLMLFGTFMLLFNWVPYRHYYVKQFATNYHKQVDERKLCQFEGFYKLTFGIISVAIGLIYVDDSSALPLFIVLIIVWGISYYPIRKVVLNLRD